VTRLLCFGDVHLGAGTDFGTAEASRLDDQRHTLDRIADLAQETDVVGVLFAGDVVHHRRPAPPVLYAWREFVDRLGDAGIPLVAVAGNHDLAAVDEWTAPEIVRGGGYYAFHRRPAVDDAIPGVAVACLPWAPISHLAAVRGGGDRDALHAEAAALLMQTARGLREEINGPAVLLTHFSISGAVTPTGREAGPDFGVVLPLDELAGLGFDAVVAGHIHKPQGMSRLMQWEPCQASGEPRLLFTGSPCVIDWGEVGVPHGVWLLDLDADVPASFAPVEDRPFVTLNLEPGDLEDPDGLAGGFPGGALNRAIVRLRYTVTSEQARRVDAAALRGAPLAAGASRVFLQPTIVREDRARVEGVDETLGPLEALALYCDHQQVNGDRAKAMRDRTAAYLEALT
jgi:DNA repair exonuclease SbcCD nuclease subunit